MTRQEYNKLIIAKLSELVYKYPDLRFGQILANTEIIKYNVRREVNSGDFVQEVIDPFYEEPEFTWERMKNNKFAFKEQYN